MRGASDAAGPWRFHLGRTWGDGPRALWVLHSPSVADAADDDPTLRRCVGFSRAWGAGGLDVVNLFAWRATRPRDVATAARGGHDVVQADRRDAWIRALAPASPWVVLGWGASPRPTDERARVVALLAELGVTPLCLGTTVAGDPRHPLYVRGDTTPGPWRSPS